MTRRHPLPAEVYALVEQTPATVLLEGGKSEQTKHQPWTQLFTAPLRVHQMVRGVECQNNDIAVAAWKHRHRFFIDLAAARGTCLLAQGNHSLRIERVFRGRELPDDIRFRRIGLKGLRHERYIRALALADRPGHRIGEDRAGRPRAAG